MGLDNGVVYFHWKPGTKYQCTAKSDSADKNLQLSLRTQNVHLGYKCANGLQSTNSFKTKSSNTKGKEQFWVSSSYSPLPQVLNSPVKYSIVENWSAWMDWKMEKKRNWECLPNCLIMRDKYWCRQWNIVLKWGSWATVCFWEDKFDILLSRQFTSRRKLKLQILKDKYQIKHYKLVNW